MTRRKSTRKKIPRRSGHGNLHTRKLTASQLRKIQTEGRCTITIGGEKKTVTPGKVRNGKIQYYRRSDTGGIALRNYARDYSIHSTARSRKGRGFEGDSRYVKTRKGWI